MKRFLEENTYVDYHAQIIRKKAVELFSDGMDEIEKAKAAYEFVRDKIPHSFDCDAKVITAKASDVLKYETGICHAKANLLAALLRSQGIPTGFCFQHITLMDDDSMGYCVHAFNAVFLNGKWIKLDARGNKPGVDAQFSMEEPLLAFPNREEYDEYFWNGIYALPHIPTMQMLEKAKCLQDILENIPDILEDIPDCVEEELDVKMTDSAKERLKKIREAEKESHVSAYTQTELYTPGSWLQKPIKTVLDILPLFSDYKELRVLDLGGGVGRNCIPIAQIYHGIDCEIECVDILDVAIEKLNENSRKYGIEKQIQGIISPIEHFVIKEEYYDFIMAVSALEHIDSESSLKKKLQEISMGLRAGGVVCLVMNSEVVEQDKESGEKLLPQFEVNLKTEELQKLLAEHFEGWQVLKQTVSKQRYDIPRENRIVDLSTDVVTYVARKV